MFIFPKNKKFVLYTIIFSLVYIVLAIICAISYANKEYEASKSEIIEKTTAPIYDTDPHSRTYYDIAQEINFTHLSLYPLKTPKVFIYANNSTAHMWNDKYYDICEYYLLVLPPSWNNKYANGYVSRYLFPWIVEYNKVTCGNGLGQFNKVHIYPYAIGFKKKPSDKLKDAKEALRIAYNRCISDLNPQNEWFVSGSRLHFTESNIANKYHYTAIYRTSTDQKPITIDSLWVHESGESLPFCYDYGNCRVYMEVEDHDAVYAVRHNHSKLTRYKTLYCTTGILIWILIAFLIFLIKKRLTLKAIKALQAPLHERLKKVCNPNNFLNPYNKEKVILANEIYNLLSQIDTTSEDQVYSLYLRANRELGINVLDNKRLNQLEELTNPSLFMNPYNEQKVLLANELYSKLKNRDTLLYKEYQEIERMTENLYKE